MARSSTGKFELYIGTFIVAGVILLTGMIIVLQKGFTLWADTYVVVVRISHVSDLQQGAPVKLGGVDIGNVQDILLQKKYIELVTRIDAKVPLTTDCKASIENSGLVGDTFLEFIQGQRSEYLPRDVATREEFLTERGKDGHVPGIGTVSMNEIFNQLQTIGTEVIALTRNVNEIAGDPEVKRNIKEAILNVNATAIQAKRLLTSLRRTSESVYQASEDIANTTDSVQRMTATLESAINQTLGDKRNVEAFNETIANARRISRSADSLIGRVDKIVSDEEENLRKTIDNMKAVTAKAKELTEGIKPDKGIMKLFASGTDKWLNNVADDVKSVADLIARYGFTDILADNKAAQRIWDEFRSDHIKRGMTAKEIMVEWKKFNAVQKAEFGHKVDPKYGPEGPPWKRKDE